ncbi:hypothetical protein ABFS83_04G030900 [Erythranthe nasuta]
MAKATFSVAIRCFLLLSVVIMSNIPLMDAKTCQEGLPWVDLVCLGDRAAQSCWDACQERHGPNAKAWCRSLEPALPTQICWCNWDC